MIVKSAVRGFAVLAVAALALAACGGDDSSGSSNTSATTANASSTKTASGGDTVLIRATKLGPTLVDSTGRTLYIFKSDTKMKSNCNTNAGCQSLWPPLTVTGAVKVGTGLDAEDFKTITRADGSKQVTDYGFPVYRYSGDAKPGDTNGDGFGNLWYAVGKEGKAAPKSKLASATEPAATTTTTAMPGY
jgi:predicted lipoprotein with Yx(FWY)xxD motif